MAPQKQQRLLHKHPEIIVATPGRLWDLISEVGVMKLDIHLLCVCIMISRLLCVGITRCLKRKNLIYFCLAKVLVYGCCQGVTSTRKARNLVVTLCTSTRSTAKSFFDLCFAFFKNVFFLQLFTASG